MKVFFKKAKNVFSKIQDHFYRARCNYIKYYETLPIDEKCILLESQQGRELKGNIFYILQYLAECDDFKDWKIYITARIQEKKKTMQLLAAYGINNVIIVTVGSEEYFKLLASAKYLINDFIFDVAFIKKEGQIYLNTWHGTPLKALGRKKQREKNIIGDMQKNFIISDYILFPNQHTRNIIMQDFMVENLSKATEVYCGYPRNSIFFDEGKRSVIRGKYNPDEKKLYAYMPTFRRTFSTDGTDKNDAYLEDFLVEIDRQLTENEILYVNFHPFAKKDINFRAYTHIKEFPDDVETYEFLNIADCLITDYSSVFFDFANTHRKIILFPYDRDEYLIDRGMYLNIDNLPFPKVYDVPSLLEELRTPKKYDDSEFLKIYGLYENVEATRQLCDFIFRGRRDELFARENTSNNKENVLIYVGRLADNGITTAIKNLMNQINLDQRNYYLTFKSKSVAKYEKTLGDFPDGVNYIPIVGDMDITISERVFRKLFKCRLISAKWYMRFMNRRIQQEWLRSFGDAHFDSAIQFSGYDAEMILMWSTFKGNRIIFVHNDMVREIELKGDQRKDVLNYAYQHYDKVAVVTDDIRPSVQKLSDREDNICTVKNMIDYRSVRVRAEEDIVIDPESKISIDCQDFCKIISSSTVKFINVGRFSPEKGHERLVKAFYRYWQQHSNAYLIIMGGYSLDNCYENLYKLICTLDMGNNVILLCKISNPFPIINACDYFILSSLYEGFGLVLCEADILGKPVVSTDIPGPRGFMQKYGGVLVEDSEDGIYRGLELLENKQVKPMNVDYDAYNQEVVREFEGLFN